jgi:hypothetical protein
LEHNCTGICLKFAITIKCAANKSNIFVRRTQNSISDRVVVAFEKKTYYKI